MWIGRFVNWPRETLPPTQDPCDDDRRHNHVRPRLSTPRQHESVLVAPPWDDLSDVAQINAQKLADYETDLNGVPLRALRQQVRTAVIAEATTYTSSLVGEPVAVPTESELIVTGHQPELFHAGVWAKNFAVAGLARKAQGTALNLIIDNDTVASTRIKVPVGTHSAPSVDWIAFDEARPQQPWEEATILDPKLFRSFAERVATRIQDCWDYRPLIESSWSAAVSQMQHSSRLCDCLTAARVSVERSQGLQNLEVPMSRVCSTPGFDYFVAFLLAHLRRFHTAYNSAIREYRSEHRMRSTTHPVPELDAADQWLEIPFWIWRSGDHRRLRPYARQIGSQVELRVGSDVLARLPVAADADLSGALLTLAELRNQGLRIRTRALTTTLFSRLFLADLFIHGIGGAKYDAMTDRICKNFLGVCPPPFATVSATVHLPLGKPYPITTKEISDLEQRIRDLRYNPDRYLSDSLSSPLIDEKAEILSHLADRRPSKQEHNQLAAINTALRPQTDSLSRAWKNELELLKKQRQANLVLTDREFSWCLQPSEVVIPFLRRQFLT